MKEIIYSLLPACKEPDIDSGIPFKADAIIANPPAYGHTHVAEALKVPIHIFFTMPWTPTSEFPHPLSRVKQSAGYRLSYQIVDSLIWLGIRDMINDVRKKKLKLRANHLFKWFHKGLSRIFRMDIYGVLTSFLNQKSYISFKLAHSESNASSQWLKNKDLYLLDNCPHDWLFLQCAAVVKERAVELAKAMENEDGVTGAVKAFFKHLPRTKLDPDPEPTSSNFFSIRRCFGCS
ncbi:Sterol 3-beta-glucosyltransferase UGT80A2 [Sesamum angolense]|uniref:Sterol 3-beta-glucosyltransferase UGT80A2 n=1 Tax=Sesamum angolense TaxID=2727404 RepID=A0AAE1XAF2_9LAMI|nr:Sterol 3-beta-glucosyltransferase UGT80A2 [Sesamum angolense]